MPIMLLSLLDVTYINVDSSVFSLWLHVVLSRKSLTQVVPSSRLRRYNIDARRVYNM